MFSTIFFPSELAYSRSQCSLYLIMRKPAHLVRTLNLANSDSITPGFFLSLSHLALFANQGFWSNLDWIEEDIHLSSQGEWLPDRCHWVHLVCKPSCLGSFPHWFRCPSTGPLQFGCAHLPYQAAAPNLASCLLLDSSHTELSLLKSPPYSRHCKGVRFERTRSQLTPLIPDLGKSHEKNAGIL